VLLFPGAGSASSHSSLVAIEQAVSPLRCTRADFPYRLAGRKPPDRPAVLMQAVVDAAASLGPGPLVLGGRSMGGRMCSMVVAEGRVPCAIGLVLVSYPLHPPGKPDKLRVEHLQRIDVPCLFVHGTRDPFGSPDELQEWTATVRGPVEHVFVDGGRHELKGADAIVASAVATWLTRLRG
jgi:predicted alpha/beta-hydrolase family hydrolase